MNIHVIPAMKSGVQNQKDGEILSLKKSPTGLAVALSSLLPPESSLRIPL